MTKFIRDHCFFLSFSLISGDKAVNSVPEDYYSTIALADTAVAYVNKYADLYVSGISLSALAVACTAGRY